MKTIDSIHQSIRHHIRQPGTRARALIASLAGLAVLLWPRKASAPSYITTRQRDEWYGPIRFIPAPTGGNPEGILITNNFERDKIVREVFPIIGLAAIHRQAAPSLRAALHEIHRKGLSNKLRTYAGGFYPRFVRGNDTDLSSHSYGTSIDVNADTNPRDGHPTADQALLAPIFEKHGWYWGNRFSRRDPMHFEYVKPPKGIA